MQSVAGCLAVGGIAGCAMFSASAVCTFCDRPVWSGSSTVCGRIGVVEEAVGCGDDELLLLAVVIVVPLSRVRCSSPGGGTCDVWSTAPIAVLVAFLVRLQAHLSIGMRQPVQICS